MSPARVRSSRAAVALLVLGLSLSACSGAKEQAAEAYSPAELGTANAAGVKPVTFTEDGAARVGLRTAEVLAGGGLTEVPYEALLYDRVGTTWVYTVPQPLRFVREPVVVDRIEGNRVFLTGGPPAGTPVVTTGMAEVWGAELNISGAH